MKPEPSHLRRFVVGLLYTYGFNRVKHVPEEDAPVTIRLIGTTFHLTHGNYLVTLDGVASHPDRPQLRVVDVDVRVYRDDKVENQLIECPDIVYPQLRERFKDGLHRIIAGYERIF